MPDLKPGKYIISIYSDESMGLLRRYVSGTVYNIGTTQNFYIQEIASDGIFSLCFIKADSTNFTMTQMIK